MKDAMQRWRCFLALAVVIAWAGSPVHAATRVAPDPDPSIVGTRQDPAVARAVAEAAVATPRVDSTPAASPATAFDALANAPRRCSPIESATRVALVAACIRSERCSSSPVKTAPACYLVKTNAK